MYFQNFTYLSTILQLLNRDPDIYRNVSELIESKNYPVEEHTVQTKDGFLLSLQRIPYGAESTDSTKSGKPVVLLQHGILNPSSAWVINFPHQSLGFILADREYDVWMGNNRGTVYSQKHIKYTPNMKQFWDFSFDEMAEYDLPALVDYVLEQTGKSDLIYIAHSQGTTQAFALLSQSPQYNQKIKLCIALAPVAYLSHVTNILAKLGKLPKEDVDLLLGSANDKDFFPTREVATSLSGTTCDLGIQELCKDFFFVIFGTDKTQFNTTRAGVYFSSLLTVTSIKNIKHLAQLIKSEKFRKYDYENNNTVKYMKSSPPEYDLSKITTKVALIWSKNDNLANPTDVDKLKDKLLPTSLVDNYCVELPNFNHPDFIIAIEAKKYVYDRVLYLIKKYAK